MSKILVGKESQDASLVGRGDSATALPHKLPSKIKLQSFDGEIFELDYNVAQLSKTIKAMVEESENPVKEDTPIKLNRISSQNLSKIIEYCKYYYKLPPFPNDEQWKEKAKRSEIKDFDLKFVQSLDKNLIFELIMASNFLYIRGLIELLNKHVANTFIKGKKIKEVREELSIICDFTPNEEQQLKDEIKWMRDLE